ncbi:MAG: hypothetical protein H6815_11780 [Phycisphaeraceae bacterium]|nr:hypothetical protein [Phycisphaerales bacterium]MCB9861119.1 hypothetical protein [Phycisphaeraceae bacterium]
MDPGEGLPDVAAAFVTIRSRGEIVGRFTVTNESGALGPKATHSAVQKAWQRANLHMPLEESLLATGDEANKARELTISMELTDNLVPFAPTEDWIDLVAPMTPPGHDGVAVRVGDRVFAMFPGEMVQTGIDPMGAWRTRLADAIGQRMFKADHQLRSPKDLADNEGVSFYRFQTLQLAQLEPEGQPVFLHRLGSVVQSKQFGMSDVPRWASVMAQQMIRRRWPGQEPYGIGGDFLPQFGTFSKENPIADPVSAAMAALALRRFSETPGVDRGVAADARMFATDILVSLAEVGPGEIDPASSPISAAAVVIALTEPVERSSGASTTLDALLMKMASVVVAAMSTDGAIVDDVPHEHHAMIAWAMVRLSRHESGLVTKAQATKAVQGVMLDAGFEQQVAHWPWIGWAAIELAGEDDNIIGKLALVETRHRIWEYQLRLADLAQRDVDLAGGIVFIRSSSPIPTWNTARPMALIATMLGDSRLTTILDTDQKMTTEFASEMSRLQQSIRFLRQLTADEIVVHRYMLPSRALGGVRSAVWDDTMPLSAQALVLLTACETQRSMNRVAALLAAPEQPAVER